MKSISKSKLIVLIVLGSLIFGSCASNKKGMKVKSSNKMYKSRDFN